MNAFRGAAVLWAAVTLAASAAVPAKADDFTWSVKPAGVKGQSRRDSFVYTVAPGQRVRDRVVVSNLSERPLTFRVYATDAFNTADGSFTLLTADRRATGLGTWIAIEGAAARTVQPGKTTELPFTLTVPAGATPGDHAGGVLAAVTEQTTGAGGRRLNIDRRVAARVYARVNGALSPSLKVETLSVAPDHSPFGTGNAKVTYRIRNDGNVRLSATARIGVTGPFGAGLGEAVTRRVPELLPGNAYTLTDRVGGVLPAGPLTASLTLTPLDPGGTVPSRPMTRTKGWWATPWPLVALVLAGIAVVYVRRRRGARS